MGHMVMGAHTGDMDMGNMDGDMGMGAWIWGIEKGERGCGGHGYGDKDGDMDVGHGLGTYG